MVKETEVEPWLYLMHHMHHFTEIKHEVHHCFAFGENGEKFEIEHFVFEGKTYHIVLGNPPDVIQDHLGNKFLVKKQTFGEVEVNVLTGLVEGQKVRYDF